MKKLILFMVVATGLTTFFSCSQEAVETLTGVDAEILTADLTVSDALLPTTFEEVQAYMRSGGDEKGKDFGGNGGGFDAKKKKKIAVDSLAQTIKDYIAINYVGATINNAFADKEGNTVVFITKADGTKVGLIFDATGAFVKEVVKTGKGGHGNGHGHGGVKDSTAIIAVTNLPTAITTYLTANYAGSTISNAHKSKDGGYHVIITTTAGITVKLVFDAAGVFVKVAVKGAVIADLTSLPTAISDYVGTNYVGATITKAATYVDGSFTVSITTTDGKKVKLLFDKNGVFVKVINK